MRDVRQALQEIIDGKIVHRGKHELVWEGKNVVDEFTTRLIASGYEIRTVKEIDISPGERVPGFIIRGSTAYFGWVFWEKFTPRQIRKLWGSVVRNEKGDWAIQIPPANAEPIFVNRNQKTQMDIENPAQF
jgi:hypothetical protein